MTGNEKLYKMYLKKLFLKNVLSFIDLFYGYHYICYFIYSDYMWRHACTISSSIIFTWFRTTCLLEKIRAVFHLWIKFEYEKPWSKLNVNFNKKMFSNCIFEANEYIYRNGYLRQKWLSAWLLTVNVIEGKRNTKFL